MEGDDADGRPAFKLICAGGQFVLAAEFNSEWSMPRVTVAGMQAEWCCASTAGPFELSQGRVNRFSIFFGPAYTESISRDHAQDAVGSPRVHALTLGKGAPFDAL